MKLIIDIPEKIVTAIQNGEDYRYDIHTAIAQGTPYEERPQDEATEEAIKGIDEILEENDIMGDVYLTERMMKALKFAQEALKKRHRMTKCSTWNTPPEEKNNEI